ncbi:hypothetical protein V8C35DRAFT_46166 [Trichoderma chlorosporum]
MSEYAGGSHKHAGDGGHSNPSSDHPDYDPRSFLFVINELKLKDDDRHSLGDGWFNRIPPLQPSGFEGEIPGTVMRYQDGTVTAAPGYQWYRGDPGEAAWPRGGVWAYDPDGLPMNVNEYKYLAVFSCNPLLPIVILNGDPLSAADVPRTPLLIFHPPKYPGRSQAVHLESSTEMGPAMCKYVAGARPSWVPSLVPTTYINPFNTVPSTGLAGELPIILGLMAFSESTDMEEEALNRIFLGDGAHHGRWHDRRWRHKEPPRGYPQTAAENPRGFLVSVYFDPENPDHSNTDSLMKMEWREALVRESRS